VRAVLATLGYVLSPDGREVLMIRREGRADDLHLGKYNGLGGKLEPDEDVCAGMRREIREEAGLACDRLELAGTVSWPGFGPDPLGADQNWFGFVFRIPVWSGTPPARNAEGTLHWVPVGDLLHDRVPLWPGDRYFLPLVFADRPRQFHGVLPYSGGQPVGWSYTEL
jgi:8-oxo-dGTP diphosphatase